MTSLARNFILAFIRIYQCCISPLIGGNCCRFEPSCSRYASEAVCCHGVIKGTLLTFWRMLRCHPFARAGYDPVPTSKSQGNRL